MTQANKAPLLDDVLKELRMLHEKATPGKWLCDADESPDDVSIWSENNDQNLLLNVGSDGGWGRPMGVAFDADTHNGNLIVAMKNNLPFLLDHIAAQAEKIAALELEVADLKNINATVYKSGRMDEAAQMGHKSRTDDEIIAGFHKSHKHQAKQITALESENKRLRETLQWDTTTLPDTDRTVMVERESGGFWWGQHVLGEWHLKYGDGLISADDVIAWRDLPISAKAALAQTAQPAKVCETCVGSGSIRNEYYGDDTVCHKCNGTGRV